MRLIKIDGLGRDFRLSFLPYAILWYSTGLGAAYYAIFVIEAHWFIWGFFAVFGVVSAVAAPVYLVGFFRLGGYLTEDAVVIRSWWKRIEIPKSSILRVVSGEYFGLWSWLLPDGGKHWSSIAGKEVYRMEFLTDRGLLKVNATVSRVANHVTQLEQINKWLGVTIDPAVTE